MSLLRFYNIEFKEEDRAFIDEDFQAYVTGRVSYSIADFIYIKNALNLTIRVEIGQEILEKYTTSILGNYLSVNSNPDSTNSITYYYFIKDKRQKSPQTVEIDLSLDVLNTFPAGRFFEFSEKSIIERAHGDRFEDPSVVPPVVPAVGAVYFRRKIDQYHEDTPGVMIKKDEKDIVEEINEDWYLVYASQNDITEEGQNIPVEIYLTTDAVDLYAPATQQNFYILDPAAEANPDGISVYDRFELWFGPEITGTVAAGSIEVIDKNSTTHTINIQYTQNLRISKLTAGGYALFFSKYQEGVAEQLKRIEVADDAVIKFYNITGENKLIKTKAPTISDRPVFPTRGTGAARDAWVQNKKLGEAFIERTAATSIKLGRLADIDRTSQKLLKIIKLPYAPIDYSYTIIAGKKTLNLPDFISVDSASWVSASARLLKINNYTGYFKRALRPAENIEIFNKNFCRFDRTDERHDDAESKIFNSDYNYYKIVYDSFSYVLRAENVSAAANLVPASDLKIDFITSSSMTSRFLFDVKNFDSDKSSDDYSNIFTVARNNEVQLYNSSYLNYLRNGYNYDVKAKQISTAQSLIGIGIGAGAGLITGNYVGALIGAGSGLISAGISAQQNENTLESRVAQLKEQAVTVSGSDDVDLLSYYSKNRAKIIEYTAPEKTIKNALNKFYFYGYAQNRIGAPVLKSRRWFNYIQGQIKTKNENVEVLPYLTTILERYALGVTVYHNGNAYDRYLPYVYDFAQEKANNELFIEEYLRAH